MASTAVQLRSPSAGALTATRPATRRPVASRVNASADRQRVLAVQSPELVVPVGNYCESHFKSVRRPTRCVR